MRAVAWSLVPLSAAVLVGGLVGGGPTGEPPAAGSAAGCRTASYFDPEGFRRLGLPRHGDWRTRFPERGQSFADYRRRHPPRATAERSVLVLQPLGEFAEDESALLRAAAQFATGDDTCAEMLATALVTGACGSSKPTDPAADYVTTVQAERARKDEAFRRQVDAVIAYDGSADVGAIAVPTLVVAGREDILYPAEECEAFARRIPGAAFTVIEGAAHAVHTEQPGAFVDAVVRVAA